ncbi:ADP-ribosylation factor GTPase-activating protein 3-like [Paramacrobiotus metropolitanus]|uniref:ADP-ribosylation factor GTPase-activating protein 3-like n=1 Tax=Paramacrobiotus metropolitanus TaxID=2943436 RepID=UPI0024459FDA|nr:ADP-ribosylation factor GTPase-activating protein 3-like [Paramacrobiotus metropolitanus]
MADDNPSKADVAAALKRLRGISSNKTCFDCGAKNPTWASVTYGIFLCIDCSAVHRSLGVHLSFIRSTQLDTNWTWLQLRAMQLGGNAHAAEFFRQHGCTTTDAQQKYNSRAAQLYKDKLQQMSIQAMKVHGSKLHLEHIVDANPEESAPKSKKDDNFDFFEVHSAENIQEDNTTWQQTKENKSSNKAKNGSAKLGDDLLGPSVEAALNDTAGSEHSSPIGKHTLGTRKTAGPKKGKLGAQKVEADFEELEKQAEEAEKRRLESLAARSKFEVSSAEDSSKISARFAYQDVDVDRKKEEERIKKADPKKAEQLERLGMGVGARGKISHSILSDMTKIEQERPAGRNEFRSYGAVDRQPKEDDWEESGNSRNRDREEFKSFEDYMNRMTVSDRSTASGKSSSYDDDYGKNTSHTSASDSSASRYKKPDTSSAAGDDAQKKFANAKSISSDMYFGNDKASDWETKSNNSRFDGKSSISSAEYFGTGSPQSTSRSSTYSNLNLNLQTPDLTEVKESVKQGITKVAGRLSTMASNVMTNIQERYG